jgi:REP element-mobilizing transposase RayT
MPRQARIDAAGAMHHVIVRGIEKKNIFRDEADREGFLDRLGQIIVESETQCYAWVLMRNHAHLLLQTGVVPVRNVMQRLLTGHAVVFNKKYGRHGQLFQNRYKSILCQEDIYFKELVRYIHVNPVRAGIIRDINGLDEYEWSGHGPGRMGAERSCAEGGRSAGNRRRGGLGARQTTADGESAKYSVLLGAKGVGNEYDRTGKRIRNQPIGGKPMCAEGGKDRNGGNINLAD